MLFLLGASQGLEGQPFDVVLRGVDVGRVAAVSVGASSCVENPARAVAGSRHFDCPSPLNGGADSSYFYATISYDTGASDTRAGPFYTMSRVAWEERNGLFFFKALSTYVVPQSAASGPQITLNAVALSGFPGDLPAASYFNALRVTGPSGSVMCPYAGAGWRYQCPQITAGRYVVDVQREQGAITVLSNQFLLQVNAVGAEVPAPAPVPAPKPAPTPPPNCNPAIDKGC